LAIFDAEESQELTEKVRQYIDQLDEDSLHTDVLSYITTDNPKAKPAIDTKTTGDEASNLSTQPKRRRAKTQFEDKKNMHFEPLTELKTKIAKNYLYRMLTLIIRNKRETCDDGARVRQGHGQQVPNEGHRKSWLVLCLPAWKAHAWYKLQISTRFSDE
jgi:hypothetical protein